MNLLFDVYLVVKFHFEIYLFLKIFKKQSSFWLFKKLVKNKIILKVSLYNIINFILKHWPYIYIYIYMYLNWKTNILNPSYLHLQDPSACATERSGAWETPTYQTSVSIPFHSHYIPRLPFQSVPMCQCDHNLLQWRRVVLSERSHQIFIQ